MATNFSNVARVQEYAAILEIGLSQVLQSEIKTHPKLYEAWLTTRTAKEFTEDELVTSGFGAMPKKTIGGQFTTDKPIISSPKDFTVVPYGLGFVAEYELMRWEKYGVFKSITKKLARSGVDRKNVLAYSILNNAFSTSDAVFTTYAGDALCSTSHTMLRGLGTGKNAPSAAIDLSYLGLQEMVTDFSKTINEDGLFIVLQCSTLMVAPDKQWVASTLLKSDYRPDNANMSHNTLKGQFKVHSAPYLTTANAWFGCAQKSLMGDHMSFDVGDDLMFRRGFDNQTWNSVFTMYAAFRVRVLQWHGLWGSQGT